MSHVRSSRAPGNGLMLVCLPAYRRRRGADAICATLSPLISIFVSRRELVGEEPAAHADLR